MWVHKSYTDLSAIDKALNMMYNCLLDFDSTPRPPQKTKRQDTKNAGIRISVNGLLAFRSPENPPIILPDLIEN